MWSVLLVEDEVFVRRRLKETMPWAKMGFIIVGEAGNGLEAMEKIREYQPDVVISDILMPLLDGVELLKQARKEGYDCRFVMLTVMSDFQYVQQALEFGATSYMLKLYMDHETLAETMDKVDKELYQRKQAADREAEAVYRKLWAELTGGGGASRDAGSVPDIPGARGRMLRIAAVLHGDAAFSVDEFLALGLLDGDTACSRYWHSLTAEGISTFFCWAPPSCSFTLFEERSVPHCVVYANWTNLEGLRETWGQVLATLDKMWYHPVRGATLCISENSSVMETADTWGLEHEIWHNLEQLRWDAVVGAVHELWEKFEAQAVPQHQVKEAAARIELLCARISQLFTVDKEALLAADHRALRAVLLARLEMHYVRLNASRIAVSDHPDINKIIAYLHEHYAQEITLASLANLVRMDDKYLSGLFKKKMGLNIIQYLHQIRIEHARRLLRETDLTISHIGEIVGFANDNYFIKIFKRFAGMTPAVFRHRT
ncbi:response regulator [Paenibacillus sp. HWE-109]|uniref:response regulator n=1 Tax=Paenibacillus sp. HWE-109 TaxID=1306526 RepID=UPI001EDE7E90|nr:response regulator [Paenibacillus sp. HWE-109]UKS26994.1 response regulator [Paenibacillus sp. HWE-109]